ncbi:CobW family GTP-binding protein [Yoonia sp.]|uniref:CobW family GTP-binding protein n=1 Tax=Yoonia sp. TaxID=2212373 RepID=UPI0025F507FD|nr:CobW family GTP-binding protein [Yoonia sp.]
MSKVPDGRIRLTILGGYLGSGKTTWLRHQLHEKRFGRVHVIVNEAAEIPVDDALLGAADGLTVLAGGCVCCAAQDSLRRTLRQLCDDRSKISDPSSRIARIVLETSGLADPAAIATMIQTDPMLVRQIVIAQIIVAADALHIIAQLRHERLGRAQIEAADDIVLTKTDAARHDDLSRLVATLRSLNPGATLTATAFGSQVALPPPAPDVPPLPVPDLSGADPRPIIPCRLDLGAVPDWTAFTVWLSALLHVHGVRIMRVKGVVVTPAGRLLLQTVRKTVQSPEVLPDRATATDTDNQIVLIGRGLHPPDLRQSLCHFTTSP